MGCSSSTTAATTTGGEEGSKPSTVDPIEESTVEVTLEKDKDLVDSEEEKQDASESQQNHDPIDKENQQFSSEISHASTEESELIGVRILESLHTNSTDHSVISTQTAERPLSQQSSTATIMIAENTTTATAVPIETKETVLEAPPLRKAFHWKQGHVVKNWKNRFFVLEDGKLTYYEKAMTAYPFGQNKKGEMDLSYCVIEHVDPNMMKIIKTDVSKRSNNWGRSESSADVLLLDIRQETTRADWCDFVKQHIEYATAKAQQQDLVKNN